jgi:DNA mismatch repair protein MutS2
LIFPANFEQKIGFDSIRQMLSESCLGPLGRQFAVRMEFSSDPAYIREQLLLTEEMRQILLSSEMFPSQDYYDVTGYLLGIRIAGTYLDTEQLTEVKLSLATIFQVLVFLKSHDKDQFPYLSELGKDISVDSKIIREIERLIDDKSQVREDASPTLKKIRKDRKSKQSLVEKKIIQELKTAKKSGWTPPDADVTIRDGRLVIPMINTYKRKIAGFVLDESSTGQTVFIEPTEVLETNNEIRELEYAERREIVRILTDFADMLRPSINDLISAYQFLGKVDFLRARSLFAIRIHACLPGQISDEPGLSWTEALHPLLFLSHSRQNKPVVPLTIQLDNDRRILIITGPNAGGKSVCLKTVGLIQYMFQCGLLPPVKENSNFGIFQKIFLDIGDEQSLENDLSTYTSKLYNIKFFIENLGPSSLFLIDEFGTGTDPTLGGSIAEASLEKINESKAFGVVTTHYSNLKLLASRLPGIINGAMLYDSARMKPLFELKMGKPGSSFTFEIARQIGYPEDVLKYASKKIGKSQLDFDKELQNLEVEKSEVQKKNTELEVADNFLSELIQKYQKLKEELEKSRAEILLKAKQEAFQVLNDSNKMIERTIKEIRESQAEKVKTDAARKELKQLKDKISSELPAPSATKSIKQEFGQQSAGSPVHQKKQSIYNNLQNKLSQFQLTLDLRGKRVEEAYALLQRYIDDAVLLGMTEIRVLHGKGNGVLRQITREYLATQKEVKNFSDEVVERGGVGITVVSFR